MNLTPNDAILNLEVDLKRAIRSRYVGVIRHIAEECLSAFRDGRAIDEHSDEFQTFLTRVKQDHDLIIKSRDNFTHDEINHALYFEDDLVESQRNQKGIGEVYACILLAMFMIEEILADDDADDQANFVEEWFNFIVKVNRKGQRKLVAYIITAFFDENLIKFGAEEWDDDFGMLVWNFTITKGLWGKSMCECVESQWSWIKHTEFGTSLINDTGMATQLTPRAKEYLIDLLEKIDGNIEKKVMGDRSKNRWARSRDRSNYSTQ